MLQCCVLVLIIQLFGAVVSADVIDLYLMINDNNADIVSTYIFVYVDDDVDSNVDENDDDQNYDDADDDVDVIYNDENENDDNDK